MSKLFQSLWVGKELSKVERLSISSFLENGYVYHLYTYDDVKNIPKGVTVKDAANVLPPDRIFKYKDHDSYAGFANLFRYKLLLENGGYWADTDIICLKRIEKDQKYIFASQLNINKANRNIHVGANNCLMMAPEGSEIMEYCFNESNKRNPKELQWGETGPQLLTYAVYKYQLTDYLMDPKAFCPISWWEWQNVLQESFTQNFDNSYCIHLWNEMWRKSGCDKSGNFSPTCIFEQLKRKYNIV